MGELTDFMILCRSHAEIHSQLKRRIQPTLTPVEAAAPPASPCCTRSGEGPPEPSLVNASVWGSRLINLGTRSVTPDGLLDTISLLADQLYLGKVVPKSCAKLELMEDIT